MTPTLFGIFLASVILGGLLAVFACSRKFVLRRLHSADVVTPPSAATVSVIFGLFVAFGASEITSQTRELRLAVEKEVSVSRSIFKYAESVGPAANTVRQSLIEYLQSVVALEPTWFDRRTGTESPAQTTIDNLVQVVTLFVAQSAVSTPVKSLIYSKVDELRQARTERIAASVRTSAISQWVGITCMAIITQMIIALGYVGKPNAMRFTVGCFTAAALTAICYLAWIDGLIGPPKVVISIQPLRDLLQAILS